MSAAPDDTPESPHSPPSTHSAPSPHSASAREGDAAALAGSGAPGLPVGALAELQEELEAERPPRLGARRLVTGLLSAALVIVLLAVALPWATGASWAEILDALRALPVWAVPAMVLLGAGALALEALTVRAALPGASYGRALMSHAAASGTALAVPGGTTLGLGLMGWILRRGGLAVPVILTGIIAASLVEMVLTSVLIPLVGLASYALSPVLSPASLTLPGTLWAALATVLGAVLALALTAVLLRRPVLAALLRQAGSSLPEHVADTILAQRDALVAMLRSRHLALIAPTAAARLLQWGALVLAAQAVGAQVPLLLTVAVFALGRLLSLVPLTPGGAGIAETVGAAALVALGVAAAEAAAAMLLLLVAMLLVPLLAGALASVAAFTLAPRQSASS
ncbi:lysylphosphatidylglycerol synthase domain-containing protein [Brachybacterium saurashtrense]|uniref:lysylphosphatidylglycerol synthase domain-containing protein n=1 Tax=Brachybacterium saurashtrense TaxID=556288 RepID=UPI0013DFAF99|nr:lysylphosphatidylglycerol synthase domain-containing protein [Brachybacterium saurashtrense]